MSTSGNGLLQEMLDEFSKSLHSALPLRNFGEFHDVPLLNERAEKMGKMALATFSRKRTNLNVIETTLLYKELVQHIKDIILKWVQKNLKHRKESELFLQKRVDVFSEDFNASVEKKLSEEPDMELDELKTFIENRKERIFGLYEDFFKPGEAKFQEDYKKMLEEKLDSRQREFIERQSNPNPSNDAETIEESVTAIDSRIEPVNVMEQEVLAEAVDGPFERDDLLIEDGVTVGTSFDEPEMQQTPNGGINTSEFTPIESRNDITEADDLENDANAPAIDGPYELPEDDIDFQSDDRDESSCCLRIVGIRGNGEEESGSSSDAPQPSSSSGPLPAKIVFVKGKGSSTYRCRVCKFTFRSSAYLGRHGDFCSTNKPFVCPQCKKRFTWKKHMENHIRTHAGVAKKSSKGSKSKKHFATRANMPKRLRHHGSGSFTCKECKISFVLPKDLHDHSILNHKNKLPFACNYCDNRFACMYLLKEHVIIHSGERPYECQICKSAFAKKMTLVGHIKNVHNEPNNTANQLTRDAAIKYFRKNSRRTGEPASFFRIHSFVLSLAIKKANLKLSSS